MTDCHPVTEDRKARRMERLYAEDGRHDPEHPLTGTFTGLHQADIERRNNTEAPT